MGYNNKYTNVVFHLDRYSNEKISQQLEQKTEF